jgi:hypothetical protein
MLSSVQLLAELSREDVMIDPYKVKKVIDANKWTFFGDNALLTSVYGKFVSEGQWDSAKYIRNQVSVQQFLRNKGKVCSILSEALQKDVSSQHIKKVLEYLTPHHDFILPAKAELRPRLQHCQNDDMLAAIVLQVFLMVSRRALAFLDNLDEPRTELACDLDDVFSVCQNLLDTGLVNPIVVTRQTRAFLLRQIQCEQAGRDRHAAFYGKFADAFVTYAT